MSARLAAPLCMAALAAGCMSPLHRAAAKGDAEKVSRLLDRGADINRVAGFGNQTPIESAIEAGRNDVVRLLLERGADPNAKDDPGDGQLHFAIRYGDLEAVRLLLKAGAGVEAKTQSGSTPLMVAAFHARASSETVSALLDAGAAVNAPGANGWTPLHSAVNGIFNGRDIGALRVLLARGADASLANSEGETPLALVDYWAGRTDDAAGSRRLAQAAELLREAERDGPPETAEERASFEKVFAEFAGKPKPPLPEEAQKFRAQAEFAVEQKRFEDAARLYVQALKVAPWWSAGYFNQALIAAERQRYPQAARAMKKYVALEPAAEDVRAAQDKIYQWESVK